MTRRVHSRTAVAKRRTQRGLTLVELMIALLLGLIITAAVIGLFLGTRATYGFQEGLSRVQENARFASQILGREVRMAGFAGCNRNIFNWLDPDGTGFINSIFGSQPVAGWEAADTGPGDEYTIGKTTALSNSDGEALPAAITGVVPGSDVLVINGAENLDVVLTGNPSPPANTINADDSTGIPQRAIIVAVTSSCSGGDMWQKTSNELSATIPKGTASGFGPGNINPSGGFTQEYDDDSQILRRTSSAYFVRNNPANEPSLFRLRLDPGGTTNLDDPSSAGALFTAEEFVEGVESMQLLYGVDDDGDRFADRYLTAATVPDWNRIASVRIALLLRSPANERVQTMADIGRYPLAHTTVVPVDTGHVRQVATFTVALRNRLP